jgi:hypothetical protein
MGHIRPYEALPTLSIKSLLPTMAWVLLISALVLAGSFQKAFAQKRQTAPAVNGVPPSELIVTGIPLYTDGCCGRLDVRAQFVVTNSDLVWAEGSDTPLKKMSKNGGNITPIAKWTGSPLNAVVRGQYLYWIEHRDHPNTGQPLPRLNRTSLDGSTTTVLDEGPRSQIEPGTTDILITDSDAYWVNSLEVNECETGLCTSGKRSWIRKVPLNGGTPTTLATTALHTMIMSLATDGTHLYWDENGVYMGSSRIKKLPLGGGQATDIVDGSLNGIAEDWEPVGGIAIGGTELFFANARYGFGYGFMKVSVSGGPVAVLSGDIYSYQTAPRKIAVDETNLYWVDMAALNSISRNGGASRELATGLGLPIDLAIGDGRVFWAEAYCCGRIFTGSIKSVASGGGAVTTHLSELDQVRSLDVASGTLYFIDGSSPPPGGASGRIARAPIAGTPITTVVTAVMADAGTPMAVDDNNLYFADASGLKKVSLQGGVVESLASDLVTDTIYAVAVDGQFVYFLSRRRSPIVRRVAVGGGPIEDVTLPASGLRHSSARLVLSDGYFYWVERSYSVPPADAIMKASVNGGPPIAIASGMPPLGDIAVSGNNVYFNERGFPDKVQRISTDGGAITTVGGFGEYAVLAADDTGVYWVDLYNLRSASVSAGSERTLAHDLGGVALALDAGGIYWMDYEGNISKITRSTIDGFVDVIAPDFGDVWATRSRRTIQWWFAGMGARVTISLSRDGGMNWTTLARNKPNAGYLSWKVTKPAASQAIIRVCSVAVPTLCDTSGTFTIQ